jgi:hypothetical protein
VPIFVDPSPEARRRARIRTPFVLAAGLLCFAAGILGVVVTHSTVVGSLLWFGLAAALWPESWHAGRLDPYQAWWPPRQWLRATTERRIENARRREVRDNPPDPGP